MEKYRKKPVVIDAVQLTMASRRRVATWFASDWGAWIRTDSGFMGFEGRDTMAPRCASRAVSTAS